MDNFSVLFSLVYLFIFSLEFTDLLIQYEFDFLGIVAFLIKLTYFGLLHI